MALSSTLSKRLFFGSIMVLILLGLLFMEGWVSTKLSLPMRGDVFILIAGMVAAAGAMELGRLARQAGSMAPRFGGAGLVFILVTQPFWVDYLTGPSSERFLPLLAITLLFLFDFAALAHAFRLGISGTFAGLGYIAFTLLYLGMGFWFLVQIRLIGSESISGWGQIGRVLMFLLTVKSADIGAYFTGRAIGRHKWVPSISPAKTWEGFFGGIILAIIVAVSFSVLFGIIPIGAAALYGMIVGIAGQLGDLLESMLKRDAAIKDSASLIPAFGGVLDLIDSVVVAAPFAYLVLLAQAR